MIKFGKNLLIGVAVLGLGSAAFVTNAQTGAAEQSGHHHRAAGGHKWHGDKKTPEQIKERIAKRQTELHDKLKLNANQESAWKTYVASMAPAASGKRPDRAEWEKLSVPERMEKQLARMNEREARMTSRLAAIKTFYATLTPEQQKIFNENFHKRRYHGKK